jgi:hypothetical protein
MYIASENLNRVKDSFTDLLENGKINMDLDNPFYNVYDWKGEVLFSPGYPNAYKADQYADLSYVNPTIGNAGENNVQFLGSLDCSRAFIRK